MSQPGEQIAVQSNETKRRYEAHVDGHLAVLDYERDGQRITYLHTEVPRALAGRGVGSRLARAALEDARAQHLTVVPQCPFVQTYLRRHPEYLPLVEASWRAGVEPSPQ